VGLSIKNEIISNSNFIQFVTDIFSGDNNFDVSNGDKVPDIDDLKVPLFRHK